MIYNDDTILLLPPKTASRWCERNVRGHRWNIAHPDLARHAALHQLPKHIREERRVVCMTRDPFTWYESWYTHMKKQPFAWNKMWGHSPVPDFETALMDYLFAWKRPISGYRHPLAGTFRSTDGDENHIENQRTLQVGFWSYMMYWTAGYDWLEWNYETTWIVLSRYVRHDLMSLGFDVCTGPVIGSQDRSRLTWTPEMRQMVMQFDGPTWSSINRRRIASHES